MANFLGQTFTSTNITVMPDGSITALKDGTTFTFEFTGTELKLWAMATKDGGNLSVSVDGGESKNFSLHRNPSNHKILPVAQDLPAGKHQVTVTLHASSNGSFMDIRHLLISGEELEGIEVIE